MKIKMARRTETLIGASLAVCAINLAACAMTGHKKARLGLALAEGVAAVSLLALSRRPLRGPKFVNSPNNPFGNEIFSDEELDSIHAAILAELSASEAGNAAEKEPPANDPS